MPGPITIDNRLKIKNPPQDEAADHILMRNAETKEVSSFPKEEVFAPFLAVMDNIKTEIAITAPIDPTAANFADVINALPSFTIDGKTIPTFKAISLGTDPVTYYVELLNIGRGDYGIGNTALTTANIKITSFEPTVTEIETLSTTQTIDLGSSASAIETVLNAKTPSILIQDQNTGYTVIKLTNGGVVESYLWLGVTGTYGAADLQSTAADFQLLSNVTSVSKATSAKFGIVKTDVTKPNPTVYVKETVDDLLSNKVNKVTGERLITAAEITKLSGLGSITTTVKPILSTVLATQNVAGFVTYINVLNPVLVVGASEIVKYNTTDTGRVFELKLRGRSFGVGQAAIVAADVLEVTEFLNKDLKLSNYPNTRNDGQLPTNRVLSTDVNGNLKLYTIAIAPAPWIKELIPDSYLPSTTGNIRILGDFFTPSMCDRILNPNAIILGGVTINYATFVTSQEILVNATTGSVEGAFSCTLDNGLSTTKASALLITYGTVFKPTAAEWTADTSFDISKEGELHMGIYATYKSATWNRVLDYTQTWRIQFKLEKSPLGDPMGAGVAGGTDERNFTIIKASNNTELSQVSMYQNSNSFKTFGGIIGSGSAQLYPHQPASFWATSNPIQVYEYRYIAGTLYFYIDGVIKATMHTGTENMLFKIKLKAYDVVGIKYIQL
ncbi:hypothetical protein ACM55F_09965 [Flavobacterium sp. XS2P12]|uniref:hypothetical protein n=1 Tax=Flavobacterium melibiosi TaxID=3398734 RepID=UPI003A888328